MLIGLNGPKQAGKDTVYERAAHIMADVLPVERASFADLLYESAAASLGVTVPELRVWKNDPTATVAVLADNRQIVTQTVREYLQRYGTEAHRDVFGDNFWVDNVRLGHHGRILMVTDVRFPNEAQAVRSAGGHVVRVVGPPGVEDAGDGHASESPLPSRLIDAGIINDVRDDDFRSLDNQVGKLIRGLLLRERP